jgi:hypothetical protein
MQSIYVNKIIENNGITHGIAVSDRTVTKTIDNIFTDNVLAYFRHLLTNPPLQPFYTFDNFCQFVVYLQYYPTLGWTIKFSNFNNNIDLAFEEYVELRNKGWTQSDRDKIMEMFNEIKDNTETAYFVIDDL